MKTLVCHYTKLITEFYFKANKCTLCVNYLYLRVISMYSDNFLLQKRCVLRMFRDIKLMFEFVIFSGFTAIFTMLFNVSQMYEIIGGVTLQHRVHVCI